MKVINACYFLLLIFVLCYLPNANALEESVAGGQSGYDQSLLAIEPNGRPIPISLAGEYPADISRYYVVDNQATKSASLSFDGKWIAFTWSITGQKQLWIIPSIGGQPKQLTFGNGVTFYRWVKNQNKLLYGADNNGDEQEAYYTISADGLNEKLVLSSVAGGFRRFGDFVDDNTIVYSSTERNKLDFDIYLANLTDGTSRLALKGKMGLYASSVSLDGKHIVVSERVGEDSDNLYLFTIGTDKLHPISIPTRRAAHAREGIKWTNNSEGFYLSSNLDSNYSSLRYYSLKDGFNELETASGDIEQVRLCGKDDKYLLWSVNNGGYSEFYMLNNKSGVKTTLANNVEGVISASCNKHNNKVVLSINGWKNPGEILVIDLDTKQEKSIMQTNMAGIKTDKLVKPESIYITARDGVVLQGLLYLPPKSMKTATKPAIVFSVHGGPTGQSKPVFSPYAQYLVGRGIAVFFPNVRGSTGFGYKYVTLDDKKNRLNSIRDLIDMLEYLKQEGRVDTDRAVVSGGSYGGYAVNAALANFPGHFIAGISRYGVSDWVTALRIASPALKATDRIEYGDISDPKWLDYYSKNSPITQANSITVPVLYSHGVKDPRVDILETETMVKTLRKNGVRAEFIRFLDEGHGWEKFSNRLFSAHQEAKFLDSIFAE